MSDPDASPRDDPARFAAKRAWHLQAAHLPLREKFRILLLLQRQDLPLLSARRALEPWERPWRIDP